MPDHIVKCYRNFFRDRVAPAIQKLPSAIKIPAFDGDFGFKDCYIIIASSAEANNPKIWAANLVRYEKTRFLGYIELNPEVIVQQVDLKMRIIAREWIEVMIAFRDAHTSPGRSLVNGREAVIVESDKNQQPSIWQSPAKEEVNLCEAARQLILP